MRGKSCSSESQNNSPHLSGAYIRSLVKQLTSSKSTKDLSDSSENSGPADGVSDKQGKARQAKKQVRRRAHTSRPYQDSLLNMAEARREIVTALKLHRAAMKQAREKQQLELELEQVKESGPQVPPVGPATSSHHIISCPGETLEFMLRILPVLLIISLSETGSHTLRAFTLLILGPFLQYKPSIFNSPAKTLGLNLNLQDFENLDTTAFHNPSSNFSSSSPSTSSSPALSAATEEIPHTLQARTNGDSGLHFGDDQWNADSVNSEECWFKFLNSMEIGPEEQKDEDLVSSPFDEVMEFPAWLNANESFSQHVNDFCSDDSVQDLALPW
ncbi:UNVERIFIED_CONTAM: hypothetical protein Slati_4582700 [Sesamum latifolium]|uniref:Uncharacterized protein n=1 Tax=Sesamum latifolium TaxID=2727402 RepID=A0AAW2S2L4_9LAMI